MKKIKYFLLFLFPVILFSGCIKVDTTINVKKDGSGTIEETVLISSAVVEMLKGFMTSFKDSTNTEEFKMFKEDEIKSKGSEYGKNVKYVSSEMLKKDGWEGYKAVYAFEDLNTLKMNPNPNDQVPTDMQNKKDSGENGDEEYYFFKFTPGNVAEITIDRPELKDETNGETDEDTTATQENNPMAEKMLELMKGMSAKINLKLDGKIVETNASFVNGSDITLLNIDFDKLLENPETLEQLKKHPPKDLEDMKEISKNIPGIEVELQKPVIIKFK